MEGEANQDTPLIDTPKNTQKLPFRDFLPPFTLKKNAGSALTPLLVMCLWLRLVTMQKGDGGVWDEIHTQFQNMECSPFSAE